MEDYDQIYDFFVYWGLGHAKLIISFSGNFFEKLTRDAGFYFIFY